MSHPPRLARLLVIALALGLFPLKSGACGGRTACFTESASDLGPGQTCPSPESLDMSFVNNLCSNTIESVDGPGTLDGILCCYPVTYVSGASDEPCFGGTTSFGGGGGVVTGTSFGGSSSSGFAGGTTTSTAACVTCNAALQGAPFSQVCNSGPLSTLRACACASNCTDACDPTLCIGNAPDNGCLSCLQASCLSDLTACQMQ